MKLLYKLLEKDAIFSFDDACVEDINEIEKRLISTPFRLAHDWNLPFEIMCDASNYAIGVVLGKHHEKIFQAT